MQLHMQADGMTRKSLIIYLALILMLSSLFTTIDTIRGDEGSQQKFYVDDDYNSTDPRWQIDHFDNINDAIAASSSGDWIKVMAGTYYETLVISHKVDIFGEGRDITIINGNSSGNVITINAQRVNISHFTITNCGNSSSLIEINSGYAAITDNKLTNGNHGITINDCNYNTIYDNIINNNDGNGISLYLSDCNNITYNTITSNQNGLFLSNSNNNTIEYNPSIKTNNINGLFLNETSNYNTIQNNNISSNVENGVFLSDHCDNNNISYNSISLNTGSGIRVENSSSNDFYSNTVQDNTNYGMMIGGSSNNIKKNIVNSNSEHGIFLFADDLTTINNNEITGNTKCGLQLYYSTNDTIYTNEISDNLQYGIYLDYQSRDNLVYNNYFHDNSNNSVDKSINNNTWNITKTNGTNVVGGSYLCGNYWDDYDEISEGAIDDGDGIAVGEYTIYASNKDKGALLDVTPPSVIAYSPSPPTQTLGGYTYISATVTDNTEIKKVNVILLDPNGIETNFSILANKTGNKYYCSKIFSTAGNYSYYIAAKDPRNWKVSSTKTFIIDRGSPPTITDNSPTTGSPSGSFLFNATVVDDADAANYLKVYVDWSHGDLGENSSMSLASGNYFKKLIPLDNSLDNLKYKITAIDRWGNSRTSDLKTVTITDSEAPKIVIKKRNYSSDGIIKTYTIGADITDNHMVSQTLIEYWYGDMKHRTAEMDHLSNNYYEKTIQIEPEVNRVYCIINATDPSGNTNNTKSPFANASGPYSGINGVEVTFNGSNSFDLDGTIDSYEWDFGDGTTGTGIEATNTYSTNGRYTITLTVTDDEGNTDTDTTYVTIAKMTKLKIPSSKLSEINKNYNLQLTKLFYCYDVDGDNIADVFFDPNNVLKDVRTGSININNNTIFLISVDDEDIPEFMWNVTTNEILTITNITGERSGNLNIDNINKVVTQEIVINKTDGWIFLCVDDPKIGNTKQIKDIVSVSKNNTEINKDRIIRKSKKTYVLDDPVTTYQFKYDYQIALLDRSKFIINPATGSTIGKDNPTITIKLNVPATIYEAAFIAVDENGYEIKNGSINIINDIKTTDGINFSYTPPDNLPADRYQLFIRLDQIDRIKKVDIENVWYYYDAYAPEKMEIPLSLIWMILGGIFAGAVTIFVILRKKNIGFESFIYIKNKKIIPFFKPVIFGPISIDVNDERVSKAEFYVNGKLKDTITKEPFIWKYDEPMFMKQKIETKVYDQNGNSTSSGEMTFFVINPPQIFK